MSFLFNNVAAFAVALVASVLVWMFGGTRGALLLPVLPWLLVVMLEIMLCFPQRHQDESMYDARARVWSGIRGDPVAWVAFGLMALLLIPLLNDGLCPGCDAARIAEGIDPAPPASFLPFCVNRLDHLDVVGWFAVALTSMLAVRHSLTRRGKRFVLELIVWNGVAVAALGFVQQATGAAGPLWCKLPGGRESAYFFSTFGYPNMAGDYFTTLFGLSLALWRDRCEQYRKERAERAVTGEDVKRRLLFWQRHYFLIPAAIFFFAALVTLSRAAILLVTATAILYFAHTLISFLARMRKARRVFVGVWSMVIFGLVVFFATVTMPEKLRKEVETLGTMEVLDRVTGRGQYHAQVATEIWKDHKLFGCGGWGYLHLCIPKMQELKIDLKQLQTVGGINVHNDYLQFLAEHGLAGFGAMVAIVVMLVWPIGRGWRRLVKSAQFKKDKERPPSPVQVFALPAPVFFILVTAVATLVHAFGDCPLRSPAVLLLFLVSLTALPGFMPKFHENEE